MHERIDQINPSFKTEFASKGFLGAFEAFTESLFVEGDYLISMRRSIHDLQFLSEIREHNQHCHITSIQVPLPVSLLSEIYEYFPDLKSVIMFADRYTLSVPKFYKKCEIKVYNPTTDELFSPNVVCN